MALFGNLVTIPEQTISGVFPLTSSFNVIRTKSYIYNSNKIATKFDKRILKDVTESWRIARDLITDSNIDTLISFYIAHKDPADIFYFYDPEETGGVIDLTGTSEVGRYTCRFKENNLSAEMARQYLYSGEFEVVRVLTSSDNHPILDCSSATDFNWIAPGYYGGEKTVFDFNYFLNWDKYFEYESTIDLAHIVTIAPNLTENQPDYGSELQNIIRCADRKLEITGAGGGGGDGTHYNGVYEPRLLSWSINSQDNDSNTTASFSFDNHDFVWTEFITQINLDQACLRFCLIGENRNDSIINNVKYYAGYITGIDEDDENGTIIIETSNLRRGLTVAFPTRTLTSSCPLIFRGADGFCGAASGATCDKTWETCTGYSNQNSFQGLHLKPATPTRRDWATTYNRLWHPRPQSSNTAETQKTTYGQVMPVVYSNERIIMPGLLFTTQDESEFFSGAGLICEGPLAGGDASIGQILLDGMTMHIGYSPIKCGGALHNDTGTHPYPAFRMSGIAFASVRRIDTKGVQKDNVEVVNHNMRVELLKGMAALQLINDDGGVIASPTIAASAAKTITIPEVAVDIVLRAMGFQPAIEAVVTWGSDWIGKLIDYTALESCVSQVRSNGYAFSGAITEQRPAIDHVINILMNAPITLRWVAGRLSFKYRTTPSADFNNSCDVFEENVNIITGTFKSDRIKPSFNAVTIIFPDRDYDFNERALTAYDIAQQAEEGISGTLLPVRRNIYPNGCNNPAQARKLSTTLLAEELGGKTSAEQRSARNISFNTPLYGLLYHSGDVIEVRHSNLPGNAIGSIDRNGAGTIEDGDTIWFYNGTNYVEYTMRTAISTAYDVLIGVDDEASLDDLIAAINHAVGEGTIYGTGTAINPFVTAEVQVAGVSALTPKYKYRSIAGNLVTTGYSSTKLQITGMSGGGTQYARIKSVTYTNDNIVTIEARTVTDSMYDDSTTQSDDTLSGDPVPGIPGGSQGSDGSENDNAALTAPTLTLDHATYKDAMVNVSTAPQLAQQLHYQVNIVNSFTNDTPTPIVLGSVSSFVFAGSAGVTYYVRAKWRRSGSPVEDSAWSTVLTIPFPVIETSEIAQTFFEISSDSTASPRGIMSSQHNAGWEPACFYLRKSRGTNVSPAIVQATDILGSIIAEGYDGVKYFEAAYIDFVAAGTISEDRIPTQIKFYTTPDIPLSEPQLAMMIDTNTNIGVAGCSDPQAKISYGALTPGTAAMHFYDGGVEGRNGFGVNVNELQFFLASGNHVSFNSGGDLQTTGTNEIMRIVADGNIGVAGCTTPAAKISFGALAPGKTAMHFYDGGVSHRIGLGIQTAELQVFFDSECHISFNSGGDLQTSGTNELVRISTSALTVNEDIILTPAPGQVARNISWGLGYGSPALTLYDGGAAARYGWALQAAEMQFFIPDVSHYSWNAGGDMQTSGTNELMRLEASTVSLGIGVTSITAALHLRAGSATANTAPLKFESGTAEATPRAGLMEYDGRFIVTESDTTNRFVVQAVSSSKTTTGAPYANDGLVEMVVDGTTIKFMTTSG